MPPDDVMQLVQDSRGKLEIRPGLKLRLRLTPEESARPLQSGTELVDLLCRTLRRAAN